MFNWYLVVFSYKFGVLLGVVIVVGAFWQLLVHARNFGVLRDPLLLGLDFLGGVFPKRSVECVWNCCIGKSNMIQGGKV